MPDRIPFPGTDFGTNSVRALIVRTADGVEAGTSTCIYPSGREGVLLDPRNPHVARQHPGDYLEAMRTCVRGALEQALAGDGRFAPERVIGIGVDSTGSSPIPVDGRNRALGMLPQFRENLAAQCWLWKDHTSHREAADHALARELAAICQVRQHLLVEWWRSKIGTARRWPGGL
jgi:L-ribulokinase